MKYKKLENLDDLRVGDVIAMKNERLAKEIVKIEGEIIFYVYTTKDSWRPVGMMSLTEVKYFKYAAKRPLPEKKEKREKWEPKFGESYYTFDFSIEEGIRMHTWAGSFRDQCVLQNRAAFKTFKEAKAALKMIKAINPDYNG